MGGDVNWPSHVRFYLENRHDIEAVIALNDRAKKELPEIFGRALLRELKGALASWAQFENPFVEFNSAPQVTQVWWSDPSLYSRNSHYGVYFSIYGLGIDGLLASDEESQLPSICLAIERTRGKHALTPRVQKIEAAVAGMKMKKFPNLRFGPDGDDDEVVAYQRVEELINLDRLREGKELFGDITQRVKQFCAMFATALN